MHAWLLWSILSVSAVQQSESATCTYPLFSGFPSHLGHHRAVSIEFPGLCSRFWLVFHFIQSISSVDMLVSISQFIPPPHTFLLCVSISALQRRSSVPGFFRLAHTCINIRYLFFSIWLTSLCVTDARSIQVSAQDLILCFTER